MNPQQSADLERTKTLVEDMHHRLFGNGQPGIIKEYEDRIVHLEKTEAKGKGAFWVFGILGSTLIVALEVLIHKWH